MPYFTSMQIQTSTLMRIKIQLLIKMIRICDHCQQTLSASIMSVWPSLGPFWASKAPVNFDFNAEPEPAFHSKAEIRNAYPISQNNVAPVGPLYASQLRVNFYISNLPNRFCRWSSHWCHISWFSARPPPSWDFSASSSRENYEHFWRFNVSENTRGGEAQK